MKTSVRRLATRYTSVALTCSLACVSVASQEWYQSYEEALAAAQREGKPIFADFSTTWCHNCKQLERETLSDPNIEARLDNFVKVHIDGDQRADMVQRYGVDAYPTLVTMDPAGRMVDKSVGFVRPPELAGTLDNQMQSLAPVLQQIQSAKSSANSKSDNAKKSKTSKDGVASASAAPAESIARKTTEKSGAAQPQNEARMQLFHAKADSNPMDGISKPVVNQAAFTQPLPTKINSTASANLPLSKAEERFQAQQAGHNQHPSAAASHMVASAPGGNREIRPLLNTSRNGVPGGGAPRGDADDLVVSQAEPRKTPASAIAQENATGDDELPRPMLNAGSRGGSSSKSPSVSNEKTQSQAAKSDEAKPVKNSTKASTEQAAAKNADQSSEEDDGMSTIRKLQSSKSSAKMATGKSEETTRKPAPKAADAEAKKTTAKQTAAVEPSTDQVASLHSQKNETASADESAEGAPKSTDVTATDIERWTKDADSKLLAGRKKEARAMYAHVYEKDPTNKFGRSDMAFIKMVSLMVDQDDDALRQKALNRIKEFEALFPDSEHKDYYTLIRATLAADLGDTNAAHRLLESFPDRFPDSKYQKLAHDTWKSLPPVTKETAKATMKDSSSSSKKSSDKKKKAED